MVPQFVATVARSGTVVPGSISILSRVAVTVADMTPGRVAVTDRVVSPVLPSQTHVGRLT